MGCTCSGSGDAVARKEGKREGGEFGKEGASNAGHLATADEMRPRMESMHPSVVAATAMPALPGHFPVSHDRGGSWAGLK